MKASGCAKISHMPHATTGTDSAFCKQHSAHTHVVSSFLRAHFNSSGTLSMLAGSMSGIMEFAAISFICLIIACGEMLGGLPGFPAFPKYPCTLNTARCACDQPTRVWWVCSLFCSLLHAW